MECDESFKGWRKIAYDTQVLNLGKPFELLSWKEKFMFLRIRDSGQEIAYNTQFQDLLYAKLNFMLASLFTTKSRIRRFFSLGGE